MKTSHQPVSVISSVVKSSNYKYEPSSSDSTASLSYHRWSWCRQKWPGLRLATEHLDLGPEVTPRLTGASKHIHLTLGHADPCTGRVNQQWLGSDPSLARPRCEAGVAATTASTDIDPALAVASYRSSLQGFRYRSQESATESGVIQTVQTLYSSFTVSSYQPGERGGCVVCVCVLKCYCVTNNVG